MKWKLSDKLMFPEFFPPKFTALPPRSNDSKNKNRTKQKSSFSGKNVQEAPGGSWPRL